MAREAGADTLMYWDIEKLKRLVELARADQREIDAKVCEEWGPKNMTATAIAGEIRARGEAK
jgi:hypothetical protein